MITDLSNKEMNRDEEDVRDKEINEKQLFLNPFIPCIPVRNDLVLLHQRYYDALLTGVTLDMR